MVGNLEERKRTRLLIVAAIIMALVQWGGAYYWFVATDQVSGTITEKHIMGYKDGTQYQLVHFLYYADMGVDPSVSDLFDGQNVNMTITPELEHKLQSRGYNVHYQCLIALSSPDNVNHEKAGDGSGYFLDSREDFNKLHIMTNVTFEVAHNQWCTIREVH